MPRCLVASESLTRRRVFERVSFCETKLARAIGLSWVLWSTTIGMVSRRVPGRRLEGAGNNGQSSCGQGGLGAHTATRLPSASQHHIARQCQDSSVVSGTPFPDILSLRLISKVLFPKINLTTIAGTGFLGVFPRSCRSCSN